MTNAEKIRRLDDEELGRFLNDVQKNAATNVLRMVADAIAAYMFDKDGKDMMKKFLKNEDNK